MRQTDTELLSTVDTIFPAVRCVVGRGGTRCREQSDMSCEMG